MLFGCFIYFHFQVINCHESVIYILAPLSYATVYGCSDATVILGAVGKVVSDYFGRSYYFCIIIIIIQTRLFD